MNIEINGVVVEFPDNLSPDELNKAVKTAYEQTQPKSLQPLEQSVQDVMSKPTIAGKVWEGMKQPSVLSEKGLKMIAGAMPNPELTGNVPLDVIKHTPRIAAETLAETAPSYISREAILASKIPSVVKAVRPLASAARKGIFSQAEEFSGLSPKHAGALEKAYKDPTLIFSKSKKTASPLYEEAKKDVEGFGSIFSDERVPEKIVDKAEEYLSMGGKLEPSEAQIARRAVDKMIKSKKYIDDPLIKLRDKYDQIAKSSEKIAEGDVLYSRGEQAEALRKIIPRNVTGTPSSWKLGVSTGLGALGVPGKVLASLFSPIVQGSAATIAGGITKGIEKIPFPIGQREALLMDVLKQALFNRSKNKEKK